MTRFFGCIGCIGVIIVLIAIIGGCYYMNKNNSRKYGGEELEEAPIVLDETPVNAKKTEKSAIDRLARTVKAPEELPKEETVLSNKIQEWAMIHYTEGYQQYDTAGKAIKKCDDGIAAIKEELEAAGFGDKINENKAYKRLLQEKAGAIHERNKYAQRIIAAYTENIGNSAAEVAAKDSGVTQEESTKYQRRAKPNLGKDPAAGPSSSRFRSIKR